MVKTACHPSGLNEQYSGEAEEEGIEQPGRAKSWEGPSSEALEGTLRFLECLRVNVPKCTLLMRARYFQA